MKVIIDNWAVVIALVCTLVVFVLAICKFAKMPTDKQIIAIKEVLLLWVVMAEKELGEKTGTLKLRYCWELFIEKFPALASIITFETFSSWVDEALERMKHLLATNESVKNYVEGVEDGNNGTN